MNEPSSDSGWAAVLLTATYLWWMSVQPSQTLSVAGYDPSVTKVFYMVMMALVFYGCGVYQLAGIEAIDDTLDITELLKNLYPEAPVLMLPAGLAVVVLVKSQGMHVVLPELIIFLGAVSLSVLFSGPEFTGTHDPLVDSILAGLSVTALCFFFFYGFNHFSSNFPDTSTFLILLFAVTVACFTITPAITGNSYIDSLMLSSISILVSCIMLSGAVSLGGPEAPLKTLKSFSVTASALIFAARVLTYRSDWDG